MSLNALIAGAISGKVVSFPTDTVPALAVRPEQSELVFAVKGRPQSKPLILMGASVANLWSFVSGTPAELKLWQQVAQQYWPGALTLVLPASVCVPSAMNPTDPTTIGIRIPSQKIAQAILSQTGPLATTSANRSGSPPLETMAEIDAAFPDVLTLEYAETETVDVDKVGSRVPSTVAKWTGTGWEILRQGTIQLNRR